MAKVNAIEAELTKALKVKPGAKEKRATFLKRMHEAATDDDLPQETWDQLTEAAQEWVNAATGAVDDDQEIPDFDEVTKEPEKKTKAKKGKKGDDDEDAGEEAEADEGKPDDDGETATTEETEEKVASKKTKKAPAKAKTKSANKVGAKGDGYKGHRAGSRKEQIHKVFDGKGGEDAAVKLAEKLKIKTGTVRSWMSKWKRKK